MLLAHCNEAVITGQCGRQSSPGLPEICCNCARKTRLERHCFRTKTHTHTSFSWCPGFSQTQRSFESFQVTHKRRTHGVFTHARPHSEARALKTSASVAKYFPKMTMILRIARQRRIRRIMGPIDWPSAVSISSNYRSARTQDGVMQK